MAKKKSSMVMLVIGIILIIIGAVLSFISPTSTTLIKYWKWLYGGLVVLGIIFIIIGLIFVSGIKEIIPVQHHITHIQSNPPPTASPNPTATIVSQKSTPVDIVSKTPATLHETTHLTSSH